MLCSENYTAPFFLWAALWWDVLEDMEPPCEIYVASFQRRARIPHKDTILTVSVVPASIKAPFGHAYGYLENGGETETHKHPTHEMYILYY